jgi:predicted transposase/invertase (TIGR01784 family)
MSYLQDKYINPLTDFGFKMLFGSEPNKEFLIDFLNQLLPAKHRIKTLKYSKNEHLGNAPIDRKAIFDIYCENEQGDKFIVEIQKAKQKWFKDRSVFYSSFPIQEQGKRGDWDFEMTAVYTIGILDFTFSENENDNRYIHRVKLKDQENKVFYDKLTYIYIELPKFKLTANELKTKIHKWLYVLRHIAQLEDRPNRLREKIFENFFAICEIAQFDKTTLAAYENSLKYYRDIQNSFNTATEEGRNLGLQEGFEKGLQKGIEEGLQKGIEEGRKTERETMAIKLLAQKLTLPIIAELTGLTLSDIEKISRNKS